MTRRQGEASGFDGTLAPAASGDAFHVGQRRFDAPAKPGKYYVATAEPGGGCEVTFTVEAMD